MIECFKIWIRVFHAENVIVRNITTRPLNKVLTERIIQLIKEPGPMYYEPRTQNKTYQQWLWSNDSIAFLWLAEGKKFCGQTIGS